MKTNLLFVPTLILMLSSSASAAAPFRRGFYVNRPTSNHQQISFTSAASKLNALTTTIKVSCTDRETSARTTSLVSFGGSDFRPITVRNNSASGTVRVNRSGIRYNIVYAITPTRGKITLTTRGGVANCVGNGNFPLSYAAVEPTKLYENDSNGPNGSLSFSIVGNTVTGFSAALVGTCDYNEAPYNIALVGLTFLPGSGQTLPITSGHFELSGINANEFDTTTYSFSSTYNSAADSWTTSATVTKVNSVGTCTFNGSVVTDRS